MDKSTSGGSKISFLLLFVSISCLKIILCFFGLFILDQGKIVGSWFLDILSPLRKWAPHILVLVESCSFRFTFLISLLYSLRTSLSFGIAWNFKPGEFRQLIEQLRTQQLHFTMTMMRTINKAELSKHPTKRYQNAKRIIICYQFRAQLWNG